MTPIVTSRTVVHYLSTEGGGVREQRTVICHFNGGGLASAWRQAFLEALEEGRRMMRIEDRLPIIRWYPGDHNIPLARLLRARAAWFFEVSTGPLGVRADELGGASTAPGTRTDQLHLRSEA